MSIRVEPYTPPMQVVQIFNKEGNALRKRLHKGSVTALELQFPQYIGARVHKKNLAPSRCRLGNVVPL